jgi:transcriptional regulator with XRE-family HTH domain
MGKSSEAFKKNLQAILDSRQIKKIELHRKTGLARNSIDGYLGNAVPDLNAVDKIAEALDVSSLDLIKPEYELPNSTVPLEQHVQTIEALNTTLQRANALCQAQAKELKELREGKAPSPSQDLKPLYQEFISLLSSLNEGQQQAFLIQLRGIVRLSNATIKKKAN